jgi:glucose/mannose-6-phosphate isomerase
MYEAINKTATQFGFRPRIINQNHLRKHSGYVAVGMGGSMLAAELLKLWKPEMEIIMHRNYGLPEISKTELKKRLIILSSYSGNTEEVIDGYKKADELGLNKIIITTGGKLLAIAKNNNVPYIQMPDLGIQPRAAIPLSLLSFLKATGQEKMLTEVKNLENNLSVKKYEKKGKELAKWLSKRMPIIYTSAKNEILGYIWKITFNETGKIPAYNNVFPELDHNEINGYSVAKKIEKLSDEFGFIILQDINDHPRVKKRMEVTAKMYQGRKLPVKIIEVSGENEYLKIFNSVALADYAAYYTGVNYGLETEEVPMVEEFKKKI